MGDEGPGASTYLQTGNGLLGISFENGSVKVSLYNVSDPGNMREIDTYLVEGYPTHVIRPQAALRRRWEFAGDSCDLQPVLRRGGVRTYERPWSVGLVLEVGRQASIRSGR